MTAAGQDVGKVGSASHPYIAGDDVTLVFTVVDSAGAAVDLSSSTIRWGLFASPGYQPATTASVSKASGGSGIDTTSAASGIVKVSIDSADTTDLDPGKYYQELEAVDGGEVSTLATGEFWITLQRLT